MKIICEPTDSFTNQHFVYEPILSYDGNSNLWKKTLTYDDTMVPRISERRGNELLLDIKVLLESRFTIKIEE